MVVTRFAPSPTGYLHIGGARTALFNWLFARKMQGRFILRIEDTDPKRNTLTAMQQLIDDLKWLGIEWDEGPGVGGPNGPYLQSERREIYQSYIDKLIAGQKAYYCFETPQQLQALRRQARAEGRNFVYPRPEVFPTWAEARKVQAEGRPITVRFAVPDGEVVVQDLVRGEVRFSAEQIGDFIIQKSDGLPIYNFACVVDDELMGVTHVIRGQEHLVNTPAQEVLQEALGFRSCVYAHISVTISESGGKLSKRERPEALRDAIRRMPACNLEELAVAGCVSLPELESFLAGQWMPDAPAVTAMAEQAGVELPQINVVDFFRSGYVPEALVNFLALLGWNPGGEREIMTTEQLITEFDLARLTKSNSLFDRKKLTAFNTEHIRITPLDRLRRHFHEFLGAVGSPVRAADDAMLDRLIKVSRGARTLSEIDRKSRFLFIGDNDVCYEQEAVEKVLLKDDGEGLAMLRLVRQRLAGMDALTSESIEAMLRQLAEEKQAGLAKVAQPLRVAICGTTISPPIFDSVDMLGKQNTLARIDNVLKMFAVSGA
jgi:glutamyl-tRNA synthetase